MECLRLNNDYHRGGLSLVSEKVLKKGYSSYELSNHLGNVLAVITDRRIQACGAGDVMYYEAQIVSISDYYPFGMTIKERSYQTVSYRFGFQGQEGDDEVNGKGNSIAFEYRIHDPRLGRFLSVDPLSASYPWNSPYAFAENRVIDGRDFEGGEWLDVDETMILDFVGPVIMFNWNNVSTATRNGMRAFENPEKYVNVTPITLNRRLGYLEIADIVETITEVNMEIKEPKGGEGTVAKNSKTLSPSTEGTITTKAVIARSTGLPNRNVKEREIPASTILSPKGRKLTGVIAIAQGVKLIADEIVQTNIYSDVNKAYDQLMVLDQALSSLNEAAENGMIDLEGVSDEVLGEMVYVMMTGSSSAEWHLSDRPGVAENMKKAYDLAWKVIEYAEMDPASKAKKKVEAQAAHNESVEELLNLQQDNLKPQGVPPEYR